LEIGFIVKKNKFYCDLLQLFQFCDTIHKVIGGIVLMSIFKKRKANKPLATAEFTSSESNTAKCFRCLKTEEKMSGTLYGDFWFCECCSRTVPDSASPETQNIKIRRNDQDIWEKHLHTLFFIKQNYDYKIYIAFDCKDGLPYFIYEENVQYGGASAMRLNPIPIEYYEINRFAKEVPTITEDYECFDYLHWYKYIPENKRVSEEGMFRITKQLEYYFEKEHSISLTEVFDKWSTPSHLNPIDDSCFYYEPAFCAADRSGYRHLGSLESIISFNPTK